LKPEIRYDAGMAESWYPDRLADLIPWHANFNIVAQAIGTTYGLSAAQKALIALDSANIATIVNYLEVVDAFNQAVTEFKNLMFISPINTPLPPEVAAPATLNLPDGSEAAIEARTRLYANIIKASPSYTPEIGEQFGIIGAATGGPTTPGLVATALTQSQVRLAVSKGGYDVVAIDSRRGGGDWEQIGVSMTAEYIDARPPLVAGQPELREYRAQGMEQNARVGALSPVVSAVTVP
jgi:hypothetical protein